MAIQCNRKGSNNPNRRGGEVAVTCNSCGKVFYVRPHRASSARFCSYRCMGKAGAMKNGNGMSHPNTKDGTNIYRHIAGLNSESTCAWCGWRKNLMVHHYDLNRRNNDPDNLVIICHSCHQKLHGVGTWLNTGCSNNSNGNGHHKKPRPGQPGTPEFAERYTSSIPVSVINSSGCRPPSH